MRDKKIKESYLLFTLKLFFVTFLYFSTDIVEEFQLVLKYLSKSFKIINNKVFVNTKVAFMKLKSKSSQLEKMFSTCLLDIETNINFIWKVAEDIIHTFQGFLYTVSSRYNTTLEKIKSQSRATRNKMIMIFKNEIKKIAGETLETLEKFRIIQEIKHFYSNMKDWLKYSDMMKNVKNTLDRLKRYLYNIITY